MTGHREIVIKIPEEIISFVNCNGFLPENYRSTMGRVLLDGVELPKGHGDLIDRSKLLVELECGIRAGNYEEGYEKYPHINDMDDCFDTVKYADTIIEADKGE